MTEQAWLDGPRVSMALGNNLVTNAPPVLISAGEEILSFEVIDGRLLVNLNIWDAAGNHVARLRRNAWAFHDPERFAITTTPTDLLISEGSRVVARLQAVNPGYVALSQADLYTRLGDHLAILSTGPEPPIGDGFDEVNGDFRVRERKTDRLLVLFRRNEFVNLPLVIDIVDGAEMQVSGSGIILPGGQSSAGSMLIQDSVIGT